MGRNFRSRTSLRQTNENYGAFDLREGYGGNLTPLQGRYAYWWQKSRPFQTGREQMQSAAFGFKGQRFNGEVVPLSLETRIRSVESVLFLSVVPILRADFTEDQRGGNYRLHFSEQVGRVEDGQICFGGPFPEQRVQQADLDKRPLQDHQVYAQVDHNPDGLGSQMLEATGGELLTGQLLAPLYGNFAVIRDSLNIRLTIEGFDVFRICREHEAMFEILAAPGEVQKGQPLARAIGKVSYLAAEPWASRPATTANRPVVDRIVGDTLSATHNVPRLTFGVTALEGMLRRDTGEAGFQPASKDCWPIPMLQITHQTCEVRRHLGWEPNAVFKTRLLAAVSPDTVDAEDVFAIRSPCAGRITSEVLHDGYKIVHFEDTEGQEFTLPIPICAELRSAVIANPVVCEDAVIGDYVPRAYCSSYEELEALAQGCIAKLEDEFFLHIAMWPGEDNWREDAMLIDARIAEALHQYAENYFLDTLPLLPFVDDEFGIATLPAVGFDARQGGFHRQVNGILYDSTPHGAAFARINSASEEEESEVDETVPQPQRQTQHS